jgi:glycosyltransferase involved in cell wall biosynthesis
MLEISLIVPVKNEALYIKIFILEVLKMRVLPGEIIFVDAGSTDESSQIINSFKINFLDRGIKFQLLFLPGAYPGGARNLGIQRSYYSWICFLDIGVFPEDNWLEYLWADMNFYNSNIVFGQCRFNSEHFIGKITCALSYGVNKISPVLPASIVHKKVFDKTGYFDEKLRSAEDILWKRSIRKNKIKYYESKKATVNYLFFPNSILKIIKKWFVYAKYESIAYVTPLPKKILYFFFLVISFIMFIDFFSGLIFFAIYLLLRGLFDPWRRSMFKKWWSTWPQFIAAPFFALAIDLSSMFGYIYGKYLSYFKG